MCNESFIGTSIVILNASLEYSEKKKQTNKPINHKPKQICSFRCHNQRFSFPFSFIFLALFLCMLVNCHTHFPLHFDKSSNDEDTDSLEIKPPQMISRYDKHKKSSRDSSARDKKHSRGEHRHKDRTRDRTDRHARQHHSNQSSGRHHSNLDSSYDKYHISSRDSSHQKRFVWILIEIT